MITLNLTPHLISLGAGVVLSLFFSYFPAVNVWYAGLTSTKKSLIMIGLLAAVAFGIQGLGCLGVLVTGLACTATSWWMVAAYFLEALITNQPTHNIAPEPKAVKEAKAARSSPVVAPFLNPEAEPDLHASAGRMG